MKYHVRRALSLFLVSQVPACATNLHDVLSGYAQIPASFVEQLTENSFFITVLLLQICLLELSWQLVFKFIRRGARMDCLARPMRAKRDSTPRDGTTLYDHLISKSSRRNFSNSDFYYQQPEQILSCPTEHEPVVSESGPIVSFSQAENASENALSFTCTEDASDAVFNSEPALVYQTMAESRVLYESESIVDSGILYQSDNFADYSSLDDSETFVDSDSALEFHVDAWIDDSDHDRLSFNSAYFACDQICDALFSKDIKSTVQLLQSYGQNPAVMSLVERKLIRNCIDCKWRLDPFTGEGELLLQNRHVVLAFRSNQDRYVEAVVNKIESGKITQTRLAFESSNVETPESTVSHSVIPNTATVNYQPV
ncbi:MAG: hypothetical protein JST44_17780 [Cyanobacteria bacterium SZAS LIN-5]|nr:hypothetical protein [Cyanobacteria bacterium SZAS LIN-5]